jgi:hypothetical protein
VQSCTSSTYPRYILHQRYMLKNNSYKCYYYSKYTNNKKINNFYETNIYIQYNAIISQRDSEINEVNYECKVSNSKKWHHPKRIQ